MKRKISLSTTVTLVLLTMALTISLTMLLAMRHFNNQLQLVSQRQKMYSHINDVDKIVREYYPDLDEALLRQGIAKGYIADDLCRMLVESGCTSGVVNLGGNVKTVGTKPDGSEWHVGIQDPNDVTGAVVAAVFSQDTSVVTSGLYERQFEKDGERYWHILDPKTGYPVQTDLVSATIISAASIDGDGYTKPLFMMGHDEALAWINNKDGIEGLVVDANGVITQSDACGAELVA
jgi:thiamine biosynthesis lipoprotein